MNVKDWEKRFEQISFQSPIQFHSFIHSFTHSELVFSSERRKKNGESLRDDGKKLTSIGIWVH